MIAVALKGLAGRKVRALLTAFAVVIGVSMVAGTYILTDTMQKAFDGIFSASYEQTDAVIGGKQVVKGSTSGSATVPQALLDKVRGLPQVAAAGGTIAPVDSNRSEIIGRNGKPLGTGGAPTFGLGYDASQPQFSPLKLASGAWPTGPTQVAVDAGTAAKQHFHVGESVQIATLGARHAYEISGIARFGDVDSLGGATLSVFDIHTAQTLLHKEGVFDGISIKAKPGVPASELVHAVQPLLPATLEVLDSAQQAKQDAKDTNQGMSFIRYFFLGFGGIALFVGSFVIFNTLSITVAQRTREFATLRTIGASRRQIMRSVVAEGLVIGLLASLLGLAAGYGIYKGIDALFKALGVDMPKSGTVIEVRTVVLSLVLGTVVTLIASIVPALRATRVPPIAAVREGAELPAPRLARHSLKAALAVIVASVAAISVAVFASGLGTGAVLGLLGGGVLALFVGVALGAPRAVGPLARLVGWPGRRTGGVAAQLAGSNAVRNPSRTAATAAALMIGLTLVTVVAVLGAGLRNSVRSAVTDQITAPYVVDNGDGEQFGAAEGDAIAAAPGVRSFSHVRYDQALVQAKDVPVSGVDPATIGRFYRFKWTHGSAASLRQLGAGGAVVTKQFAKDAHLAVGSRITVESPSGDKQRAVVGGIYDPPDMDQMLGQVSIAQTAFDGSFPQARNRFTFIDAPASAEPALHRVAAGFNDAKLHTAATFPDDYTKGFASFLNMLYVLLAFSVVVSLFGMVNTLVLSVFERTRELGMLRAIGMTRRQARRMIRHESVITALIGAALGLPLGTFLAALVTQALSKYGVSLSIPVGTLVAFTAVAVLAGVGAAVLPARRAARLDVLGALHYE